MRKLSKDKKNMQIKSEGKSLTGQSLPDVGSLNINLNNSLDELDVQADL